MDVLRGTLIRELLLTDYLQDLQSEKIKDLVESLKYLIPQGGHPDRWINPPPPPTPPTPYNAAIYKWGRLE